MKNQLFHKNTASLKVGGVLPFSLIDYPNCLSAVIFCQGCPWRCRYCHNVQLQPFSSPSKQKWSWEKILTFLRQRQGLLEGVVFSGGEPTLQPYLIDAIEEVKRLEFKIGLHSAAPSISHFIPLLSHVDWVGLDVKALSANYPAITKDSNSGANSWRCVQTLLESGLPYELRTTVHPLLHTEEEIWKMAQQLHQMGVSHYTIQLFQEKGCVDKTLIHKTSAPYLSKTLVDKLYALFDNFTVR